MKRSPRPPPCRLEVHPEASPELIVVADIVHVLEEQAALADEAYANLCMGKVIAERRRLAAGIEAMGFRTLPSRANFVSFDYGRNSVPLMSAMATEGVFVREWRDPGYETFVRITVGLPEENDRALAALARAAAAQRR